MAKKKLPRPLTSREQRRSVSRDRGETGLSRKDVVAVCDNLTKVMVKSVKTYGMFNYMGLLKLTLVRKPAVAAASSSQSVHGEMVKQKARPASRSVRVRPLKSSRTCSRSRLRIRRMKTATPVRMRRGSFALRRIGCFPRVDIPIVPRIQSFFMLLGDCAYRSIRLTLRYSHQAFHEGGRLYVEERLEQNVAGTSRTRNRRPRRVNGQFQL